MAENPVIFEARGISKTFPGVKALSDVRLTLHRGEVLALIGENGAGKSTMMKIMLGQFPPTEGSMTLRGEAFAPGSPSEALHRGVCMIQQEISLVPGMTVAENLWLGREEKFLSLGLLNLKKRLQLTRELLTRLDIPLDPDALVGSLSIASMQLVEIVKAVSYDADVIIMDEPTSALTQVEIDKLFTIIRGLRAQNKAIIYISHKLEELFTICDRVTVFRDGKYIDTRPMASITQAELVRMMVGREMSQVFPAHAALGSVALEVEGLVREGAAAPVSFSVRHGEVLGFCGLMGAGRTEIMQTLFGIQKKAAGTVRLHGNLIHIHSTKDAIENKLAMVTEDRLRRGAIHKLSVQFNLSLSYLSHICALGFVRRKQEKSDAQGMIESIRIKVSSPAQEIGTLSGGNQQKVIIGKWLLTGPEVLILDEPTRGIDVGAKAEIYQLIGNLASAGKAILLVSSELPELMGLSDRILVIKGEKIVGEFHRPEFNEEALMARAFDIQGR